MMKLLALILGMGMGWDALSQTATPVSLLYGNRTILTELPPLRLGDECFFPLAHASQLGWNVTSTSLSPKDEEEQTGRVRILAHGKEVESWVRSLDGRWYLPIRSLVESLGGTSEWVAEDRLQVFSLITQITITETSVDIQASLPVEASILILKDPWRLAVDLRSARLPKNEPPKVSGPCRFSQFDFQTVRVVVQLNAEPQVSGSLAPSSSLSLQWTGAKSLPTEPYKPPAPSLKLLAPLIEQKPEEITFRIPFEGTPPSQTLSNRDETGKYFLDIPGATKGFEESNEPAPEVPGLRRWDCRDLGGTVRFSFEWDKPRAMLVSVREKAIWVRFRIAKNATGTLKNKVIVLDAGHGGSDAGAQFQEDGKLYREKDFTLGIARRVAEKLADEGCQITMTRDDDFFVGVYQRAEMANALGAHFFISIHINSNPKPNSRSGTYVYYHGDNADSRLLAQCLSAEIAKVSGLPNHGAVSDFTVYSNPPKRGFAVLRTAQMPAVLIEVAYINHRTDRAKLIREDFQEAIAQAIVKGLRTYVGQPS
jgi:N-acetylmuramoyl-L-alanine amidase